MSKSKYFLYLSLSFIIGIAIASYVLIPFFVLFVFFIISTCILILFFKNKKIRLIFLLLIFLVLGVFRFETSRPFEGEDRIHYYNEKEVLFQGVVNEEPDVRSDHVKLKVAVREENISGNVLIKNNLYPRYDYGDLLEIKCKLKTPKEFNDFAYDKYLARYNIYSLCYWPQIKLVDNNKGSTVVSMLLKLKGSFMDKINKILPEPQSSFLAGLLLGAKKGMPQELTENFNTTGLTHIVAISGYNITIIAAIILKGCQSFYISRRKSFWISVFAILFFTIITGASSAVVRASVMGIIVLLAMQSGRISRIENVLVLAALLILLFNPKILIFDIGFQLSFMATIGLVYVTPILDKKLEKMSSKFALKEAFTTTTAAIIMTTPIILYNFGRFSIVAPIANILVLPVIPINMAVGFMATTLGFIFIGFGQIIGWFSWALLSYIIKVAEIFSSWQFASVEIGKIHWVFVVGIYFLVFWWIWKCNKINTCHSERSEESFVRRKK